MPTPARPTILAPLALAVLLCFSDLHAEQPRPTAAELWQRQAGNADQIRAGRHLLEQDWSATRYRLIDRALEDNAALLRQAEADPALAPVVRSLRQDRLVALAARRAGPEAWAQVALLEADGEALPPYALQAAGDAAMLMRRPLDAIRYYQRALDAQPAERPLRVSLAYAQLEAEDFAALWTTLAALERDAPGDAGTQRLLAQFSRFSDLPRQARAHLD